MNKPFEKRKAKAPQDLLDEIESKVSEVKDPQPTTDERLKYIESQIAGIQLIQAMLPIIIGKLIPDNEERLEAILDAGEVMASLEKSSIYEVAKITRSLILQASKYST